jgi:hypothetical protein
VYATEYPWFFTPNVFSVASDGLKLRFGAAGAPTNLYQPFRPTADDENLSRQADAQRSVELLMNPATILDMLANFVLFETSDGGADKKYRIRRRRPLWGRSDAGVERQVSGIGSPRWTRLPALLYAQRAKGGLCAPQ